MKFGLFANVATTFGLAAPKTQAQETIPAVNLAGIADSSWGWGLLISLLGITGMFSLFARRQSGLRAATAAEIDAFTERAAQVMSMAARVNGKIDSREIHAIRSILSRITGRIFPAPALADLVGDTVAVNSENDFVALGAGLCADDRERLVQAALMIVVEKGDVSFNASCFISKLSSALEIGQEQFNDIVDLAFGTEPTPAAPALSTLTATV